MEVQESPGRQKWGPLRLLRSRQILVPIRKSRDFRVVRDWAHHLRIDSGCWLTCCTKADTASEVSMEYAAAGDIRHFPAPVVDRNDLHVR